MLASDGLWDNSPINEIYSIIAQEEVDLRKKTGLLMEQVMHNCQLPVFASPYFSKAASRGIAKERRGKLDDVSIILA